MKESFVNQRYIDVLIALNTAYSYEKHLGRVQLQKFIFLADTIAILWSIITPKVGHETYKYGPFDEDINNAADVLAFRGFIDVVSVTINEDKKADVLYKINSIGLELYEKLLQQGFFVKKVMMYKQLGIQIEKRGWDKLKSLVYAEPTYMESKAQGWGFKFDHTDLRKNLSLRILLDFESLTGKNYKMHAENIVYLFFKLISSYE